MSYKTAVEEYGWLGIVRRSVCLIIGHDYGYGRVCLYCDERKEVRK